MLVPAPRLRPLLNSICGCALWVVLSAAAPAAPVIAPYTDAERALIVAATSLDAAASRRLDDAALTERLLAYARIEAGQRVRPASLDTNWTLQPPRRDLLAELRTARAAGRLSGWIAALPPAAPQYGGLKALRARYARLATSGGWRNLEAGRTLRRDVRGAAVLELRDRLAREGFLVSRERESDLFDAEVEEAVRAYQAARALEADGVVGPATRRALNVSAAERLAQIDANLERWRWAPTAPPGDRFEVDTGGQEAVLYRAGAPVLRMRAIVGDPKHPTPMFASRIEAVVLNPPWNVPTSIAANELLPAERRSPGYLARRGIRWVDGHLQQRPGPDNALGLIKFDIPNRFGVYLHDTPVKTLFARPVRALSHGCMRLEKPRELALSLLEPQGVGAAALDNDIANGATRRIALQTALPVYVQHWTVEAGADGRAVFRPDVYGWDRKLAAALTSGRGDTLAGRSAGAPEDCAAG